MSKNKEQKFVSAVVYVHNNELEIEKKLDCIASVFDANFERYEIVCVNDASTDKSVDCIKDYSVHLSNGALTVVNLSFYHGLEAAMNAGVDLAIGDFVYEFDTLNTDISEKVMIDLYHRSLSGHDIVSAVPQKNRSITSRLYYRIFNSAMHGNNRLEHETMRILTRRAVNRVHGMSQTIPYRKAFYANCGLKLDHMLYSESTTATDSRSIKEKTGFALDSLVLFTNIAYKIAFALSVIMVLFAVGIAIYTLVIFFGEAKPIEGWTSTMLFLSVGFFGLFALMGIMLKYMAILVDLVFNKQKYFIESVEKINNRR